MTTRTDTSMTIYWKTPNNLPFALPLELSINGKITTLPMDKIHTIAVSKHDLVTIDPKSKVLYEQKHVGMYQTYLENSDNE